MALNEAEQATIVENSGQWVLDYIAEIEQQLAQARKQAFLDAIATMERVRGHEAIYFRVYAEALRQEAEKS